MKKLYILFITLFISTLSFGQTTLSSWSFEGITFGSSGVSPTLSAGSFAADSGILTSGSEFTGLHASSTTAWSTPAGNGSAQSLTSNRWAPDDYYQFKFSTKNYSAISISFDVDGSNTGPKDFKVQYSTDGSSFTDLPSGSYIVSNVGFSSGSTNSSSARVFDLSSITSLNDVATVYIRLVNTSTVSVADGSVGNTGSSKVDNFTVKAYTTLGIVKNQIDGFAMYPNPVANGKFTIATKNNAAKQVNIYSLLGKQVYSKSVKANEAIVVSNLNRGVYILRVEEEGKIATRKLVIN